MSLLCKIMLLFLCYSLEMNWANGERNRHDVAVTSSTVKEENERQPALPMKRMRCPYRCKCNAYTREVNCAYKRMTNIPRNIPTSTRRLILTGNRIKHLPNRTFMMLRHLEVLEVSGNHIESISNRLFRPLRKLTRLNLSSNKLEVLPPRVFRKLGKLHSLILRNNKLGKLPIDVFAGLSQVAQIDLSANFLQTLEVGMFYGLAQLTKLYLDSNRWHCDCLLKKAESELRQQNVRIGYIICDSPNQLKGHHLRERPASSLCGTKADDLVYILLGGTTGILAILFTAFMCRRRIAPNIDTVENTSAEKKSLHPHKRSDSVSKSSIIFESDNETTTVPHVQKPQENNTDLFKTSQELNVDILSLTNHPVYDDDDEKQVLSDVTVMTPSWHSPLGSASSCPNLAKCSFKLDKFANIK